MKTIASQVKDQCLIINEENILKIDMHTFDYERVLVVLAYIDNATDKVIFTHRIVNRKEYIDLIIEAYKIQNMYFVGIRNVDFKRGTLENTFSEIQMLISAINAGRHSLKVLTQQYLTYKCITYFNATLNDKNDIDYSKSYKESIATSIPAHDAARIFLLNNDLAALKQKCTVHLLNDNDTLYEKEVYYNDIVRTIKHVNKNFSSNSYRLVKITDKLSKQEFIL